MTRDQSRGTVGNAFGQPAPRRPIGAAIRRDDETRTRAAEVTPADILDARMMWMRYAPPGWRGLIEARRMEVDDGRG